MFCFLHPCAVDIGPLVEGWWIPYIPRTVGCEGALGLMTYLGICLVLEALSSRFLLGPTCPVVTGHLHVSCSHLRPRGHPWWPQKNSILLEVSDESCSLGPSPSPRPVNTPWGGGGEHENPPGATGTPRWLPVSSPAHSAIISPLHPPRPLHTGY